MNVNGKSAVVTGGASGIGLGIATALAERGCNVMVADIDGDKAKAAAAALQGEYGIKAEARVCDVSQYQQVVVLADAAWDAFSSVQLVFNNAGVMSSAPVIDADPREVDWMVDINLKGVWNGCSVFGKRFRDAGKDAVIGITASEHGVGVPHLGGGIYTGTKHALVGMADVMRQELPDNIKVSMVFPGVVQTELYDAQRSSPLGRSPEKTRNFGKKVMAHGRDPLEIGRCVVDGAEAGEFMVITHPHIKAFAEKRWLDFEEAFGKAPRIENPDQYEVNALIKKVVAERK